MPDLRGAGGLEGRSQTDRLEMLVDSALGVARCPARRILKQSDATDRAISAQIEPMPRATGYAEEVSGLYLDRGDPSALGSYVKKPWP